MSPDSQRTWPRDSSVARMCGSKRCCTAAGKAASSRLWRSGAGGSTKDRLVPLGRGCRTLSLVFAVAIRLLPAACSRFTLKILHLLTFRLYGSVQRLGLNPTALANRHGARVHQYARRGRGAAEPRTGRGRQHKRARQAARQVHRQCRRGFVRLPDWHGHRR